MHKKGISKQVLIAIIIATLVLVVWLTLQQVWSETGTSTLEMIFG